MFGVCPGAQSLTPNLDQDQHQAADGQVEEGRGGEEGGMEQEEKKASTIMKLFSYQTFVVVVQHVFKLKTDTLNSKFQ